MDDDILLRPWCPRRCSKTDVAIVGHDDRREWRFFADRRSAFAEAGDAAVDVVGSHEEVLGRALSAFLAESGGTLDLEHACSHMIAAIGGAGSGRVRLTYSGIAGDSGHSCPYRLLFQPGDVRDTFLSKRDVFDTAMSSREIHSISRKVTLTHDAGCMAYCMGIDNEEMVPPFSPVGRNSDGVFGELLACIDKRAVFAHLPHGIRHDSHRSASFDVRMQSARESRVSELLLALIYGRASSLSVGGVAQRLRRLGRRLEDVGSISQSEFAEVVIDARLVMAGLQERLTAGRVAQGGVTPDYWYDALAAYSETVRTSADKEGFFVPIEFRSGGTVGDGMRLAQEFVRGMGELLSWWPRMWRLARERSRAGASA